MYLRLVIVGGEESRSVLLFIGFEHMHSFVHISGWDRWIA